MSGSLGFHPSGALLPVIGASSPRVDDGARPFLKLEEGCTDTGEDVEILPRVRDLEQAIQRGGESASLIEEG